MLFLNKKPPLPGMPKVGALAGVNHSSRCLHNHFPIHFRLPFNIPSIFIHFLLGLTPESQKSLNNQLVQRIFPLDKKMFVRIFGISMDFVLIAVTALIILLNITDKFHFK